MTNNVKQQYWKYSLIFFTVFLGLIIFRETLPFLSGVLGAITIYILVRKQMERLCTKRHMKRSFAALLILGEVLFCFLIPAFLAIWLLINRLTAFDLDPSSLISTIQHFINLIQDKTGYDILNAGNISTVTSYLTRVLQTILGEISFFIINAVVLLFVLYFMLTGSKEFEKYMYEILPFSEDNRKNVLHEIKVMVRSNAIGIPLLAVIQGIIAMIGYIIFGAPDPVLFGFLTCFATILPLIGTSLIWFPLAVYLATTGNWFGAIGLAAYALLIISNVDNVIRFILQKQMANTHPLITVFGVIIGLTLFGFWGVIFGPLLISMFILCLNMFKKEYLDSGIVKKTESN